MIKAVFFDMDNTLVETEWAAAKAVGIVVNSFGKTFSKADEDAVVGRPWESIFQNVLDTYALPINKDELKRRILDKKDELMADNPHTLPGAIEAVKLCASRYPTAIVSGSFRHEVEKTASDLGLNNVIRFIVANEDCQPGKPNPGPFLLAAEKLGIDPAQCVVFEDSIVGIEAANSAGMHSVAVEVANKLNFDLSHAKTHIHTLETVTSNWLDALETTIGGNL